MRCVATSRLTLLPVIHHTNRWTFCADWGALISTMTDLKMILLPPQMEADDPDASCYAYARGAVVAPAVLAAAVAAGVVTPAADSGVATTPMSDSKMVRRPPQADNDDQYINIDAVLSPVRPLFTLIMAASEPTKAEELLARMIAMRWRRTSQMASPSAAKKSPVAKPIKQRNLALSWDPRSNTMRRTRQTLSSVATKLLVSWYVLQRLDRPRANAH
jgi:hypothetical protein